MRAGLAAAVAALVAVAGLCGASGGGATAGRDLSAYSGLGTWVDVYDVKLWADPEAAVGGMARRGVRTLFLETSNYRRPEDVVAPDLVDRFVDAAHANGLRIVAWYLPSLANIGRDARRMLAAARLRTPDGQGFDSVALDIEAKVVATARLRSARAAELAARVRAALPAAVPLGAIVPSPRGMQLLPAYWPGFPFEGLARSADVFLPMGYFTYRPTLRGGAGAYTRANVELLRSGTGDPAVVVHAIGGLASAATPEQVRAFAAAARSAGALGWSLYDYAETRPEEWRALGAGGGR